MVYEIFDLQLDRDVVDGFVIADAVLDDKVFDAATRKVIKTISISRFLLICCLRVSMNFSAVQQDGVSLISGQLRMNSHGKSAHFLQIVTYESRTSAYKAASTRHPVTNRNLPVFRLLKPSFKDSSTPAFLCIANRSTTHSKRSSTVIWREIF